MSAEKSPAVSIVVVSDYGTSDHEAVADLTRTLKALGKQKYTVDHEVLLVEESGQADRIRQQLAEFEGEFTMVAAGGTSSYDLKNAGANAARGDVIVLLDGDCAPHEDWFTHMWRALRDHPEADVVSGRTLYQDKGVIGRIMALLDRTYIEASRPGKVSYISNNNAAFRRDVLLRHPLGNELGPFGSRAHSEAILRDGGMLHFEPGMAVDHAFGGFAMARGVRAGQGFAIVRLRQLDPTVNHRWIATWGLAAIPFAVGLWTLDSWRRALLYRRRYDVAVYQLPIAFGLAVALHLMEIPGMIAALRRRPAEHAQPGGYR